VEKTLIATYFLIFATLLAVMSVSRHTSDKMRGHSVALAAPLWERVLCFKSFLLHPSRPSPFSSLSIEENQRWLELKNRLLETEISFLHKELEESLLVSSQMAHTLSLQNGERDALSIEDLPSLQRRRQLMKRRREGVPARVIFRSLDTWNSVVWINVGESTNQPSQPPLIALNSPVVLGQAIVGVIDYVGKDQSRVQLISDSRLSPSVRVARGGEHHVLIAEQIERLLQQMERKENLSLASEDQRHLSQLLRQLKQRVQPFKKTWYLAKGELLGSRFSAKLGQLVSLKGTGFNYDFPDEEGGSRDLRQGRLVGQPQAETLSILQINDILVTTGMDGVFPPDFQVAIVTRVEPLKEGDYFYDLEAEPIAPLRELTLVFVLSPLVEQTSWSSNS